MKSEVGGVREWQCKDMINKEDSLQEEQFKSVRGRDVFEDSLTSLRRNSMLI